MMVQSGGPAGQTRYIPPQVPRSAPQGADGNPAIQGMSFFAGLPPDATAVGKPIDAKQGEDPTLRLYQCALL